MNNAFTSGVVLVDTTTGTIGTAEKDVAIITDQPKLKKTQLDIYLIPTIAGTSISYTFYVQHEQGGNWYALVKQNAADNTLDGYPAIYDGTTPAGGVMYQLPLPSCFGFKVTAKADSGTTSATRVKIMGRDN